MIKINYLKLIGTRKKNSINENKKKINKKTPEKDLCKEIKCRHKHEKKY